MVEKKPKSLLWKATVVVIVAATLCWCLLITFAGVNGF